MTFFSDFARLATDQLPLAIAWLIYALIHSFAASHTCKAFYGRRWPQYFASYRLLYNLVAGLLLVPIGLLSLLSPGPELWRWTGLASGFMNGLAILALLSFWRSGSGYDLRIFLGLRASVSNNAPPLVISDWHRWVRHPWYCLALILIWTRDMTAASLVSALMITLYFMIGSRLEEHKLVKEFGQRYREYQRQVPGLIPRPWRHLSKAEAQRLAG